MNEQKEEAKAGERSREKYVKRLFDRLAPVYDRGNALISFGMHIGWKRDSLIRAASMLDSAPKKIMDGCCGTGDFALLAAKEFPEAAVSGIDQSAPMLIIAKKRALPLGDAAPDFVVGDLTSMSDFHGIEADLFTIGFGLRNIPERTKALAEIRKTLRKGGVLLVLELAKPAPWYAKPIMFLYLKIAMPLFSLFYTGKSADYLWLSRSLEAFPDYDSLCRELTAAGFRDFVLRRYGIGMIAAIAAVAE